MADSSDEDRSQEKVSGFGCGAVLLCFVIGVVFIIGLIIYFENGGTL